MREGWCGDVDGDARVGVLMGESSYLRADTAEESMTGMTRMLSQGVIALRAKLGEIGSKGGMEARF